VAQYGLYCVVPPMRLLRAITCATALTCLTATPSATAAEGASPLSGYAVTAWTDADGRPFGAVYSIVQDADGYLWIGTNAGLLRFDGTRFTQWEAIGSGSLPNMPVTSLCLGADGSLWVGLTNGAGVYRIRNRQAVRQDIEPNLRGSVTALAEDRRGTVWAVAGSMLYRLHNSKWEHMTVPDGPYPPPIVNVSVRRNGELLVGTNSGLFQYLADSDHFQKTADGWVWAASEDSSGALWITDTVAGFRRVDEVRSPRRGFERNGYRLKHDRYGNLWLATIGEGLWRVAAETARDPLIERATLQTGLFSDSVQSLFEDREGNLWVGTTVGLHRLTRQKLTPVGNVGLVVTAEATGDGDLWVGTNYGVSRFSLVDGRWRAQRTEGRNAYVRALHRDPAGTLWVGTSDGLMRIANSHLTDVALPASFGKTPVTCITTNSHGDLWIGDGKQLFEWDGAHLTPFQPRKEGEERISFAHFDSVDRLWIAFWDGSVGILSPDRAIRVMSRQMFGQDDAAVLSILDDPAHHATWFATSNGISRLKDQKVTTLTGADGLPGSHVWSLAQDRQGFIWASVDLGVVRFSPDEFENAIASPGRRLRYELYDPSDGLAGAPILNVRSGSLSDGKLWFVRGGALTLGDPASLANAPATTPGPVRIEGATSADRRFAAEPHLAFPAGSKRIEINYTTVALTHPNRILFRYRLDGFDTQWIEAGTRRSASYTNLPPRNYIFRLEADTDDGTWHDASAAWDFSIRPTFYQTWYFYTACLLALSTVAWGAWRFRIQLDRQKYAVVLSERTRLSREIHDTLLQSLVGVTLQLEDLANDVPGLPSSAQVRLVAMRRRIAGYIREARRSIRDLRSPMLETHDLLGALREVVSRAIAGAPVRTSVSTSGHTRRCSARVENELLRIVQEAVTNTVRHARATRIDVILRFENQSVTLEISDDGCGLASRTEQELDTHYGIISMRERAESLGGRLEIASSGSSGTRVTAALPDPDTARVA
jgi:signal transduction histidine kinase/ligand-binding sensor domain-containing protein